jgi:hypothetical protein
MSYAQLAHAVYLAEYRLIRVPWLRGRRPEWSRGVPDMYIGWASGAGGAYDHTGYGLPYVGGQGHSDGSAEDVVIRP